MQNPLTICLWFDHQAEEAASFYTGIFSDSRLGNISRFGSEGLEFHGKPEGSAMTVEFTLNGMSFLALNGGPLFKFNESVSVMVHCKTQQEIDHYWARLSEGGTIQQCGWLKDRYGVSWQIVPEILPKLLADEDKTRRSRVEKQMFQMTRFDIAALEKAYNAG